MTKGKILGDIHQIDKDVELCRTTNERISNQAAQLLIENQIPFTRGWIKVPFFLREKYYHLYKANNLHEHVKLQQNY